MIVNKALPKGNWPSSAESKATVNTVWKTKFMWEKNNNML